MAIPSGAMKVKFVSEALLLECEKPVIEKVVKQGQAIDNANIPNSAIATFVKIEENAVTPLVHEFLNKVEPKVLDWHLRGVVHVHKLPSAFYLPYCGGFDSLKLGRKPPCVPGQTQLSIAKHFDAILAHTSYLIYTASQERTGAVGLNYVDVLFGAYIRHDTRIKNYGLEYIEQQVQGWIFDLNENLRYINQAPFSNVLFIFPVFEQLKDMEVWYAGKKVGYVVDYVDEATLFLKAFVKEMTKGDAIGRPFTFPIPTVLHNQAFYKRLREDPELWKLFWLNVAVRGQFYFLNIPEDIARCFCCRLKIDLPRGIWYLPALFGSINYISINMPRLAYVAKDETEFFDKLRELMNVCRKILQLLRKRYEMFYEMNYYPLTKFFAEADGVDGNVIRKYYYNTIAVVGMAEAVSIWILKNRDDLLREMRGRWFKTIWHFMDSDLIKETTQFYKQVVTFMHKVIQEFSIIDGVKYNIEQAPAESASVKLALKDLQTFGKAIEPFIPRDIDPITGKTEYFYTSQNTPYYTTLSLDLQIDIEAEVQKLYSGGVVKILQVHKPFIEWDGGKEAVDEGLERLEKFIHWCMNKGVIYLGYTPVQNFCLNCGYFWVGYPYTCPRCGSDEVESWSRIVGYYKPVKAWNPGRRAEFATRLKYSVL